MRQNLEPTVWGPHAWFFLESIALGYPQNPTYEEIQSAKNFLTSLKDLIPCERCRHNFKKHLKKTPLTHSTLSDNEKLFKWIVDIHNSANTKNHKSYHDTFAYYMGKYSGKKNKKKSTTSKTILIIVVAIIIIFAHKYLMK